MVLAVACGGFDFLPVSIYAQIHHQSFLQNFSAPHLVLIRQLAPYNMASQFKPNLPTKLPPFDPHCRSDDLHVSRVSSHEDTRRVYLEAVKGGHESIAPPPLISRSNFVPLSLLKLLMRKKKNSALGVKFISKKNDEITDMEGAMHTFVTPVVPRCEMIGDYRYQPSLGGHGTDKFGEQTRAMFESEGKCHIARSVVLSASIQMDFENSIVMLKVCKLGSRQVVGLDILPKNEWAVLDTKSKQNDQLRHDYDEVLRCHMVYHLTKAHKLPSRKEIEDFMDVESTITFLELLVTTAGDITERVVGKFTELGNHQIVSLELLFNTALHQARNEFAALEALCPQGYVYTYDPASIFAREIGAGILNRLFLAALKHLSNHHEFENMRVFGFNDYADRNILNLLRQALAKQQHVKVTSKQDLFNGPGGRAGLYDVSHIKEAEGAMLVVHNNSDGFGQNIETEGMFGSLDGAIGSSSSAAASLERKRKDLLDFIW
ncbi:hypothetical protein BDZ45DRAFT_267428 [Acephala macrosclerotiorum]|nr:hypothetical protein BDZ45DRAFT_267428 [Acephala macrosclerotiorum]